eukprot:gene10203-2360_t
MFTVRIWREMRCLASSSTQLRHAGFFSSILGKVEKNDDNQKDETDKPKVEDADAKPAQEVLKSVQHLKPESVEDFVIDKLASLRGVDKSGLVVSDSLSSIEEKYQVLADCEEAFDEHVISSRLVQIKTVQDIVSYFNEIPLSKPKPFGYSLQSADKPGNLVLSDSKLIQP